MTHLSRVPKVVLCIAAMALLASGLGAEEPETASPAEHLASLLNSVPSNYLAFRGHECVVVEEAFGAMRALSDAELREAMRDAKGPRLELFYCEMIRRGGKDWSQFVEDRWQAERKSTFKASATDDELRSETALCPSVELLTALRRMQGKPDPLQILVAGRHQRFCTLGHLPSLFVLLTNLDIDRAELQFTDGGDYRTGRQARWRLEVTDPDGHVLPQRSQSGLIMGGGISTDEILQYGESWATSLNIRSFVHIDAPGTYKIRVLYHDHVTIADCSSVAGLIVSSSLPIELTVQPITLEATPAQLDLVRKSILELPTKGPVKFVEGDYGEEAHDFIEPDSPAGKLLTIGWLAVPMMIDAALDEELDSVQRAWLLALLGSITQSHDPRDESGVLGAFEARECGWSVWGGTPGEWSGGLGTGASWNWNALSPNPIDSKRQMEFAKRWAVWKQKEFVKTSVVEGEECQSFDFDPDMATWTRFRSMHRRAVRSYSAKKNDSPRLKYVTSFSSQ